MSTFKAILLLSLLVSGLVSFCAGLLWHIVIASHDHQSVALFSKRTGEGDVGEATALTSVYALRAGIQFSHFRVFARKEAQYQSRSRTLWRSTSPIHLFEKKHVAFSQLPSNSHPYPDEERWIFLVRPMIYLVLIPLIGISTLVDKDLRAGVFRLFSSIYGRAIRRRNEPGHAFPVHLAQEDGS